MNNFVFRRSLFSCLAEMGLIEQQQLMHYSTIASYLLGEFGNGSCNPVLLTVGCCWDGGDCEKVFGDCKATYETCPGVSGIGPVFAMIGKITRDTVGREKETAQDSALA